MSSVVCPINKDKCRITLIFQIRPAEKQATFFIDNEELLAHDETCENDDSSCGPFLRPRQESPRIIERLDGVFKVLSSHFSVL